MADLDNIEDTKNQKGSENMDSIKKGSDMKDKRLHFLSAQRYYMIAIHIAIFFSIYAGVRFGVAMGEIFTEGTWFVLGGFSLWFPTSALILPFILLMFLYVVFTRRWITIGKENGSYTIKEEYLYLRKEKTKIQEEKIQYIKYSQGHLGPKLAWIVVFGIHMIYILTEGIHILTNPNTFGFGTMNGIIFVVSGLIDAFILVLILVPGENILEIRTQDEIYKLKMSHWKKNKKIPRKIMEIFGLNEQEKMPNVENSSPKLSRKSIYLSKSIIVGLLFIIIGILSTHFDIFAGAPLRVCLYLLGILYITLGYKDNQNSRKIAESTELTLDEGSEMIQIRKKALGKDKMETFRNIPQKSRENVKFDIQPKSMNWLETILVVITVLLLGWTLSAWFRFLTSPRTLQGVSALMGLGILGILGIIIEMVISPQHGLFIIQDDNTSWIHLSQVKIAQLIEKLGLNSEKPVKNWVSTWKAIWKSQQKTVKLRIGIILAVFVVGIIIALF